ncbi:hypothetical protein [Acinetobacter sp. MD2]|uniref:hypothetical protein n=1 Tax=Acinetobacter sp. MD2 TaxID=2600066 RepID=UPI002D1E81F3|nr:hypothetical protein [Acinetobacter sp. MD2]MEB3768008.1 hypothetical protein [Acinetobacter sp. MD2]
MKQMKKPNRYAAPLVITGITVAVLAKAYQLIFKKAAKAPTPRDHAHQSDTDKAEST